MLLDNFYIALIALIVGFGFLIFVHELGHFLVAKAVGIRCTQFAIGFGGSLLTWRKGLGFRIGGTEAEYNKRIEAYLAEHGEPPGVKLREPSTGGEDEDKVDPEAADRAAKALGLGETEYRWNYLPLGGYVKMVGQEDLDPTARSNDPRSFNAKPAWARACVIAAGVTMNLIFGLIFFIVAFMIGVDFPPAIVGGTSPSMPAANVYAQGHQGDAAYRGMRVGDHIVKIDGNKTRDMVDVRVATALGSPGQPLTLTVQRPGLSDPLIFKMTPQPGPDEGILAIGVTPPSNRIVSGVSKTLPGADQLEPGMELVAVAGKPVKTQWEYEHALAKHEGEPVPVTFAAKKHPEKTVTIPLAAHPAFQSAGGNEPANLAGFVPATRVVDFSATKDQQRTPAQQAGMKVGDLFARVQGQPWPATAQLMDLIHTAHDAGTPVRVTVYRDGKLVKLPPIQLDSGGHIGVYLGAAKEAVVGQVVPETLAASLQLPAGSRITAIGDQPIHGWTQMVQALHAAAVQASPTTSAAGAAVPLNVRYEVLSGATTQPATATASAKVDSAALAAQLAAVRWAPPAGLAFGMLRVPVVSSNPIDATRLGFVKTWQFTVQTYLTLARLFQGSVHMKNLRGPIGIVSEGTQMAQNGGMSYLLFFLGLISVNLVVINFLPIPIVDGGLMTFLIIEKLKGSPVSIKVQAAATYVGLALIAFVFLATLFYDVGRLFH